MKVKCQTENAMLPRLPGTKSVEPVGAEKYSLIQTAPIGDGQNMKAATSGWSLRTFAGALVLMGLAVVAGGAGMGLLVSLLQSESSP